MQVEVAVASTIRVEVQAVPVEVVLAVDIKDLV
jgi:hypothetical protein